MHCMREQSISNLKKHFCIKILLNKFSEEKLENWNFKGSDRNCLLKEFKRPELSLGA